MSKILKIVLALVILGVVVGGGFYWYATRPTKAPTVLMQANGVPDVSKNAFQIDPGNSTASFTLGEVLRGEPKIVLGTTREISGSIQVDSENLQGVSLGTVRINARTFKTDDENRNRAIQRLILKTEDDANEYIEWTPTGVQDLPERVEVGVKFPFTMVGTLKIAGVTHEETFRGTAQFASANILLGSAEATVNRADYDLVIPSLPFIADVDEQVRLNIDIMATR